MTTTCSPRSSLNWRPQERVIKAPGPKPASISRPRLEMRIWCAKECRAAAGSDAPSCSRWVLPYLPPLCVSTSPLDSIMARKMRSVCVTEWVEWRASAAATTTPTATTSSVLLSGTADPISLWSQWRSFRFVRSGLLLLRFALGFFAFLCLFYGCVCACFHCCMCERYAIYVQPQYR